MSTPTPFESEMLSMMKELKSDVSELKSDVSELKSDVSELKSDVSELKSDMHTVKDRLTSIEDNIFDMRDEMRAEQSATRALLGQAFEHISDQMASKDQAVQPSVIFRHSRTRTRV
jgi:chromosome segregation ATPase